MSKKLITGCLGLLALAAFMLPAAASASPVITHPTGTRLDPKTGECTGVKETRCITATNVGETLLKNDPGETSEPTVLARCTSATMTGYLTKNDNNTIEGTIHTATFSGSGGVFHGMNECTGSFGNIGVTTNGGGVDGENVANGTPWCVRATEAMAKTDEFQIRGGACSEEARPITFILASTTAGECKYTRSGAINGTYTTHSTGDAVLSVFSKKETYKDTTFTREAGGILCPATGTLEMSFTLETDEAHATPLYIS